MPSADRRGVPRPTAAMSAAILLGALLLGPAARAAAPLPNLAALRDRLAQQAILLTERFAPKRFPQPPDWALRKDPPLATLAILADSHYDDSGTAAWARPTRDRLLKVARFLRATVRPDAVIHLGDLIAFEQAEQLRHAKALFDAELTVPFHCVPGNHDGPAYEEVFGPRNTSFAIGGVRFIGIGITNWHWDSGWGVYERIPWLQQELAAHRDEPTLALIHAPLALPTFANNAAVLGILDAQPQVLAILAGHLHVDYELPLPKPHFGFPMLARPPHAFKILRIYRDGILILTYEDEEGGYRQANVYQRVGIPTRSQGEKK